IHQYLVQFHPDILVATAQRLCEGGVISGAQSSHSVLEAASAVFETPVALRGSGQPSDPGLDRLERRRQISHRPAASANRGSRAAHGTRLQPCRSFMTHSQNILAVSSQDVEVNAR